MMSNDFLYGKAVRMLRVVTMGWFAYGAIHFDNPEIQSCGQLFPSIEADIQPAVIEAINKFAYSVNGFC